MVRGVTPELLSARFPALYHMAYKNSWPSIQRHGLLSTKALCDLFDVDPVQRTALELHHRPESVPIYHPDHGMAVIRDQKPLTEAGLQRALLDDLEPEDWFKLLNGKVFFWLTRRRLEAMLGARAYRDDRHAVLVVDTAKLLARHGERVSLSAINSGCTKPFPQPRGLDTFQGLEDYPFQEWDQKRGGKDPVVEVAVDYSVPDVREITLVVEEAGAGKPSEVIWQP